jgi:hypothetical protein
VKRGLIWLSVILVAVVGGRALVGYMQRSAVEHNAKERIRYMLDGIKPHGDFGRTLDMWATGETGTYNRLSRDEADLLVARFTAWSREKGIKDQIGDYTIDDATFEQEGEGIRSSSARVFCVIDGRRAIFRVAQGEQVEWAE